MAKIGKICLLVGSKYDNFNRLVRRNYNRSHLHTVSSGFMPRAAPDIHMKMNKLIVTLCGQKGRRTRGSTYKYTNLLYFI